MWYIKYVKTISLQELALRIVDAKMNKTEGRWLRDVDPEAADAVNALSAEDLNSVEFRVRNEIRARELCA